MAGFVLNISQARAALGGMFGETVEQANLHRASPPEFPVSAAGQGFAVQGTQMAEVFKELHLNVEKLIQAVATCTDAAVQQVNIYAETEAGFSRHLDGVAK